MLLGYKLLFKLPIENLSKCVRIEIKYDPDYCSSHLWIDQPKVVLRTTAASEGYLPKAKGLKFVLWQLKPLAQGRRKPPFLRRLYLRAARSLL